MPDSAKTFDAIIIGARVAGSAAAIFLARDGRRVLLVDKDSFPSDRLSTHIVLAGGTRVLARLGMLETLERLGGVRFAKMRSIGPDFDYGGELVHADSDDRGLCLGRVLMDSAMIDAARSFESVEFCERFRLTDLLIEDGAVVGIRGEDARGSHEFHAPLTIGADGMRSSVAQLASDRIGAFARTDVACARAYYYAYFEGVDRAKLGDEVITEFESGPGAGNLVCRCENGLTVAATAFDAAEMQTFRIDLPSNLRRYLERSFAVGKMLEGSTMVGKVFSSGLLQNTYRDPVTDGALLLGDAGLHVDPLFGQGHSLALMSAAIVADLAPNWFSHATADAIPAAMLANFTERRDAELMQFYNASVKVSRVLALDKSTRAAHRAAARERWAADEMIRFAQMLTPPGKFPSFKFARLMAQASRAA
jgi:flavin-dependent dehydrogenase